MKYLTIIVLCCMSLFAHSQGYLYPTKGSAYLHSQYHPGTVQLIKSQAMYAVRQMRYNVLEDYLELRTGSGTMRIEGIAIKNLRLNVAGKTQHYINAKYYKIKGIEMAGLMQIVERGALQLLKLVKVSIKSPTYNIALNVGTHYEEILQKPQYYFARKGQVYKINNRRSIYSFFENTGFNAKKALKSQKISVREETGKQLIVQAYNHHLKKR